MAIATSFRDYYSSIYVDCAADFNAFAEFNDLFTKLTNNNNNNDAMTHIDVELIEMSVKHLKSSKAAGSDRLVDELNYSFKAANIFIFVARLCTWCF